MQLSWKMFETQCMDSRGVQLKFEGLCRQLFIYDILSGNQKNLYLHSNPNNPGIETEPIQDEVNNRLVGFQAKYFDSRVDYNEILSSAKKTVEYYAGKVDRVYLFCNKPLKSDAKGIMESKQILKSAGISLELITNETILDMTRRHEYLAKAYFGSYVFSHTWFVDYSERVFDEIGERYNRQINVTTDACNELSMFVQDSSAFSQINNKKKALLNHIEELTRKCNSEAEETYLQHLTETISKIPDITKHNLDSCFLWKTELIAKMTKDIKELEKRASYLQSKYISEKEKDDKQGNNQQRGSYQIRKHIEHIETLLSLPNEIELSHREQALLQDKCLFIRGKAGSGKTQLLAYQTKLLLDEGRNALFLIAGVFYSSDPIQQQITNNIDVNLRFEELIGMLDTIGKREGHVVPVFIDALNETWKYQLWRTGLPLIMQAIENCDNVKLVVSFRPEYETALLSDQIKTLIEKDKLLTINHNGFENNSVYATKVFLDHYGIPFTPSTWLGFNLSNPLFLTLYCKTYNGENVELPELYSNILKRMNQKVQKALRDRIVGFTEDDDIVTPFVKELSTTMLGKSYITREDLLKLHYWAEYGVPQAPMMYILTREGLINTHVSFDEKEYFYFSYDQMNDYYGAKAVIEKYKEKDKVRQYIIETVLAVDNGKITNWDLDLFSHICALYAQKNDDECIDVIDALSEKDHIWDAFEKYIASFQWRNASTISEKRFLEAIKRYPCNPEVVWDVLICNSVKVNHPLNARFLHKILSAYELNQRDYLWTIYINRFSSRSDERIIHLVELYEKGDDIQIHDPDQIKLLLILFAWLLTSTDRWLRDNTSKAMIEILKKNFALCKPLLKYFEATNDPYVVQRLYCIVFGVCCKKTDMYKAEYSELAEYVYNTIFNKDTVYPDILLRDNARMIIERFLVENPERNEDIDHQRISPPYKSDPIPDIAEQNYFGKDYGKGVTMIIHSMCFEGMGMYGDFGRYVFQSALHYFDVDDKKIFNYAMHYILNVLGYREDLFGENDLHGKQLVYNRHDTIKCERIGKKYQWITMYNILARIADHNKYTDKYNYEETGEKLFAGPWEPFVRDFDPTLNKYFMNDDQAPIFESIGQYVDKAKRENIEVDISSTETRKKWLKDSGSLFNNLSRILVTIDNNGQSWVSLSKFCNTGYNEIKECYKFVFLQAYGFFATTEQADELYAALESGQDIARDITSVPTSYNVYNREFPWSPSCEEINQYSWNEMRIATNEKKTETYPSLEIVETDIEGIPTIKPDSMLEDDLSDKMSAQIEFHFSEKTREVFVERSIGKLLSAIVDMRWESEYDATKEETISWSVPCGDFIRTLQLEQKEKDGFYYDNNGKLAAFDTYLVQNGDSVVVRQDILEQYLQASNRILLWIIKSSKEIHKDEKINRVSDWAGLYIYDQGSVTGKLKMLRVL